MLSKHQIASIERTLAKHQKAIARERDKLDKTIAELSHLRDNCDTAWQDLQAARDALSELV